MNKKKQTPDFTACLRRRPDAYAIVRGSPDYPDIIGSIRFYSTAYGTVVISMVQGLPVSTEPCKAPIFALHIHEGESCEGNAEDYFAKARTHYNPKGCPHPYHSGDLPPLFSSDGYAFGAVLTDRFNADEIIGRTVLLHSAPDDFTTQPAGNAGEKIACGEIISRYPR